MSNRWLTIIKPHNSYFNVNIKEIYQYRDLIYLFVKRDFISLYKQTILGTLWFLIQPLMTTLMFFLVFNKIAKIETDQIPPLLFYFSGLTFWSFFSESLLKTSNTFAENQSIFGKVYFPRLATPISIVISSFLKFGIQFLLFIVIYFWFVLFKGLEVNVNIWSLIIPYLVILTGLLGLGFGIVITSLTTKYRDLRFLIQFGVQLWMYATPIIYPLSELKGKIRILALINPMTSIVESFKFSIFGSGSIQLLGLVYSSIFAIVLLTAGVLLFNKTQQNFMDTI